MRSMQVLRHEPYADERLWEAAVAGPYELGLIRMLECMAVLMPCCPCVLACLTTSRLFLTVSQLLKAAGATQSVAAAQHI